MSNICTNCDTENSLDAKFCKSCGYSLPKQNSVKEVIHTETETDKKVIKKKSNIPAVIGSVVGFFAMYFLVQSFFNNDNSIDKEMKAIADELNKTCPVQVDEYTVLENTVALPGKVFQYNYKLIGLDKSEVNLDTVRKYVYPGILENIKTNPSMEPQRKRDVTFKYYYKDKNGAFVDQYVVKPNDYK